jgi:hypothetical protein
MSESTMTDMPPREDTRWRPDLRSPIVIALASLLVLQLLIAIGIAMTGGRTLATGSGDAPLFRFTPEQVQRIQLANGDGNETLALTRQDEGWVIADLGDAPVQADKVGRLLDDLVALKRPLPVGASEEARKRFKVADDGFERRVVIEGDDGPLAQLIVGDSPGFRRVFARVDEDPAVYDLRLAVSDVSPLRDDWVQTDLLRLDAEQIAQVKRGDWILTKGDDGTWTVEGETRPLDQEAIKALILRLGNLSYRGILGVQDDPAYGQATPESVIEIGLADGTTREYRISQAAESEDRVLKDRDRAWYFKVTDLDLGELIDLGTDALLENPEPLEPPGMGEPAAAGPEGAGVTDAEIQVGAEDPAQHAEMTEVLPDLPAEDTQAASSAAGAAPASPDAPDAPAARTSSPVDPSSLPIAEMPTDAGTPTVAPDEDQATP